MRVKCVINIDYLFACHTIYTRIEYQCKFTIVLIVYGVPLGTKISKGVHIISNCRRKCQTATKNIKTRIYDSKPTQKISKRIHMIANRHKKYQIVLETTTKLQAKCM